MVNAPWVTWASLNIHEALAPAGVGVVREFIRLPPRSRGRDRLGQWANTLLAVRKCLKDWGNENLAPLITGLSRSAVRNLLASSSSARTYVRTYVLKRMMPEGCVQLSG